MKRFTISLDDDLAVQLDRLMKERNYSNRSEVFRDILRDIIAKEDLAGGCRGARRGELQLQPP